MEEKLEKKLFEKYPRLFVEKDLPATETCMCWGVECSSGWYNVIDALCAEVDSKFFDKLVQFSQVKEKFGMLRVYLSEKMDLEVRNDVYGVIHKYEEMSLDVCEACGSDNHVYVNKAGRIRCLCENCRNKDGK